MLLALKLKLNLTVDTNGKNCGSCKQITGIDNAFQIPIYQRTADKALTVFEISKSDVKMPWKAYKQTYMVLFESLESLRSREHFDSCY